MAGRLRRWGGRESARPLRRGPDMNRTALFTVLFGLSAALAHAQGAPAARNRICMDVAHRPIFWGDPADVDPRKLERVKYMTGELTKTAAAVDASLSYL